MRTVELKSKTLLKVPQGAYVPVLPRRQQQGLTVLSVISQQRFNVFAFVQILQSADTITSIVPITNLSSSIQIP